MSFLGVFVGVRSALICEMCLAGLLRPARGVGVLSLPI